METGTDKNRMGLTRVWWYLILVAALSAFCWLTLHVWLLPYSIAYQETGTMTAGYFLYAAIGLLFSTPGPFIAVLIISLFIEKTGYISTITQCGRRPPNEECLGFVN